MRLVGLSPLVKRLHQLQHDAPRTRIAVEIGSKRSTDRPSAPRWSTPSRQAGATQSVISDPAVELLFRASRGVLRVASKILRVALRVASDKNQAFLDEHAFECINTLQTVAQLDGGDGDATDSSLERNVEMVLEHLYQPIACSEEPTINATPGVNPGAPTAS